MTEIILMLAGIAIGFNLLMYGIAFLLQTDKLTDISYALSFLAILIVAGLRIPLSSRDLFVSFLVGIWALRLGSYLFIRILSMGTDKRFDKIRENPVSFLGFWLMQGVSVFIISWSFLPSFFIYADPVPLNVAGIWIAVTGLVIESVADFQKFNFKKKHPNQFMQRGLWQTVRHPNYAGEILFWTGICLACLSFDPLWILTSFAGPAWISLLLLRFSGIPPLEKKWEEKYGDDPAFRKYKARSYKLIPFIY